VGRDLTVGEFADEFGVVPKTVLKWIRLPQPQGVRAYRLPGRHCWRIPADEVERIKREGLPRP
jgi:hypothetical protein